MNRPEQMIQRAIIEYADLVRLPVDPKYWHPALAKMKLGQFLHFTPNGGHLTPAQRGIFKAMGLRAGVWDLQLRVPISADMGAHSDGRRIIVRIPGMWIEVKSDVGKLSERQAEFNDTLFLMDYARNTVRSVDDFTNALARYFENARPLNYDWSKE